MSAPVDRTALFRSLAERRFDVLVLGGGATGAGIARDAILRGLSVALVEKGDLASGTSSASSKLIHGGLRYLEQGHLGLVFEGTHERALLTRNAPHLARPLGFVFPVYETSRVGMATVSAGMWLYDLLAMFRNYRRHRMLTRRRTLKLEPALDARGLRGAAYYFDCMTNDARLTLETALDAQARGAVVATYAEASELLRDQAGTTTGVRVRDLLHPDALREDGVAPTTDVHARVVVVAAGPWTDRVLGERLGTRALRPTKGSHIVVEQRRLPVKNAVVMTSRRDGRVMFAIPWGSRTILGTTDTDEVESPDEIEASLADVDYLLDAANQYFPEAKLGREDVLATWSGLRPLMADGESEHASDVSREHEILNLDPGLVAIVGGKLTTYRKMAEQVVDRVLRKLGTRPGLDPCQTATTPLPGASDPAALRDLGAAARKLAEEFALDTDVSQHLVQSYGLRAAQVLEAGKAAGVRPGRLVKDLPFLVDEVAHAVRFELAQRVEDVLRRRTLVFLQAHDQGLRAAREVAEIMGDLLGWSPSRRELELDLYRERVAASRLFRLEEDEEARAARPPVERHSDPRDSSTTSTWGERRAAARREEPA